MYINEFIRKFDKAGFERYGCTEADLTTLREVAKKSELPKAYLEFMSEMGRGVNGEFLCGEDCFMDSVCELKKWATEILQENKSKKQLTDIDYVFLMSQGCMFCFFKLNEGDDPPVYFFTEDGSDRFIKISNTFSEFLINRLSYSPDTFKEKA